MPGAIRFTTTISLATASHSLLPTRSHARKFCDRFVERGLRFISSSPSLQSSFLKHGNIGGSGESKKPSVAIVGTGAVGGYYGARLWESGKFDVKFQMRGENYNVSTRNGLRVDSINGNVFIPRE